jgi:valyl-tRNA synthetase
MDSYEFSKCLNPVRNFFWLEFADYYIEEVKHRIYGEDRESKKAAQFVLQKVIWETLLMFSPFVPHVTEEIAQSTFKSLLKEKSIHLEKWPEGNKKAVDPEAEEVGAIVTKIISLIRKEKSVSGKPLNAPVKKATVKVGDPEKLTPWLETIKHTMKIEKIETSKGELAAAIEL